MNLCGNYIRRLSKHSRLKAKQFSLNLNQWQNQGNLSELMSYYKSHIINLEDLENVYKKASKLRKTQHQAEWDDDRRETRRQLDNSFATWKSWHVGLSQIEMNIRALRDRSKITEYCSQVDKIRLTKAKICHFIY